MGLFAKCARQVAKLAHKRAISPSFNPKQWKTKEFTPRNHASVYWVGHSLMNETASSPQGPQNVMSLVAQFAKAKGCDYSMFDHTLYGAPLSLQWRGKTHSYDRVDEATQEKAQSLPNRAAQFDTYILTEIVPLHSVYECEFSPFYLQTFTQCIHQHKPNARIYVYESWDYWNGTRGGHQPWHVDWVTNMHIQRKMWEKLCDTAMSGCAITPNLLDQLKAVCTPKKPKNVETPIYLVPVGQAFLRLHKFLKQKDGSDNYTWADGRPFVFSDVFKNPLVNIPKEWPLTLEEQPPEDQQKLSPRDPSQELDDIHASIAGIYLSALVHFAVIYGQNPVGLPGIEEFSEELCLLFQEIAWEVVVGDERSGVNG